MEVVDPDQETGWCQPPAAEMDPDTKLVLHNSAVDYIPHVAELVVDNQTVVDDIVVDQFALCLLHWQQSPCYDHS